MAGRDTGKTHAAIEQSNHDLRDLQSAHDGYSQRRDHLAKQEQANAIFDLQRRYDANGEELGAEVENAAARLEAARVAFAKVADRTKQRDRMYAELESAGQRPKLPASAIIRNRIGEVRRPDGVSEYGRRLDIGFAEILSDNPSNMRRAQVMRRGRVGETNLARDMATDGWMKLAQA